MSLKDDQVLIPGDLFSTKGKGPASWLLKRLIVPGTAEYHFGIIRQRLSNGDYEIIEARPMGVSSGLLSFYKEYNVNDITFYRVNCSDEMRSGACDSVLKYTRDFYDYPLILKIFLSAAESWLEMLIKYHTLKKLTPQDFRWFKNDLMICTEVPETAYNDVGFDIIRDNAIPIPNAYKQAELEGRITKLSTNIKNLDFSRVAPLRLKMRYNINKRRVVRKESFYPGESIRC